MIEAQLAPILGRKSLENTYTYAGGTISILISGEDTGGTFSMWEGRQKPGSEPPLHVHYANDETFVVLEGKLRILIGDDIYDAGPGDVVFAPRGIPHAFKIKSEAVRALTVCTPAGFEEWFRVLGEPAKSFDLPDHVEPFSDADFPKMMALGKRLQTEIIGRQVEF
jgi:mannose-6-phosphate isomerase-like protein (cupin superfamily)